MIILLNELIKIFESANEKFLTEQNKFILSDVSERSMCGQLMLYLEKEVKTTSFSKYSVDIEYNRNKGNNRNDTKTKNIINSEKPITCDIILHSRGEIIEQDNLIAIEMKKSNRSSLKKEKKSDIERLQALTEDNQSHDSNSLPEHVCGYVLGVYYEVNLETREVEIEYYYKGNLERPSYKLPIVHNDTQLN